MFLFVDDKAFYIRGYNIQTMAHQLQQNLDKLVEYSSNIGLKFSVTKSVFMVFTKRYRIPQVDFQLYNSNIEQKQSTKFLGMTWDSKLCWHTHLTVLKNKCNQAMNIMKVLGHTTWGSDRKSLERIYKMLIRSKIDFGSIIYDSANGTDKLRSSTQYKTKLCE